MVTIACFAIGIVIILVVAYIFRDGSGGAILMGGVAGVVCLILGLIIVVMVDEISDSNTGYTHTQYYAQNAKMNTKTISFFHEDENGEVQEEYYSFSRVTISSDDVENIIVDVYTTTNDFTLIKHKLVYVTIPYGTEIVSGTTPETIEVRQSFMESETEDA